MSARRRLPRLALVAGLGTAMAWLALHREFLHPAGLEAALTHLGPWAPAVFVAMYALATILFVPGALFSLAGGALAWAALLFYAIYRLPDAPSAIVLASLLFPAYYTALSLWLEYLRLFKTPAKG